MTENNRWKIARNFLKPSELVVDETLFHTANGYLGVRGNFEEGYLEKYPSIRGTYINGFYDISEVKHGEKLYGFIESKQKMINLPDIQGIELFIEGDKFSLFEGVVLEYKRSLDMRAGVATRFVKWQSPKGHILEIDICRMASFIKPELFVIEYKVTSVNYEGEIILISTQIGEVSNYFNPNDPRVAGEPEKHLEVKEIIREEDSDIILCETKVSKLQVISGVKHVFSGGCQIESTSSGQSLTSRIRCDMQSGETKSLIKYCIFTDSIRYSNCFTSALCTMHEVTSMPIENLYKLQKDYLDEFWKIADVVIEGDEKLQQGIRYSIFQLLQSAGKDKYSNIAAKGLSGEGYEGHYFWDTEIYMLPFFLLTQPKMSEALLGYRYEKLDAARENARKLGHKKGALYPWRTISGSECSAYFPSGSAQYHINADIAYMFVQHYLAVGDIDFVINKSAEVLFETARLWMDTGHYNGDVFRIDAVTGPDEYTCLVNNNYYTNIMAKYNLKWAVKFYELVKEYGDIESLVQKIDLTEEEVKAWNEASSKMYLPYDEMLDINPQDDAFLKKAVWDFENTPKSHYPLLLHYHPLYIYRYQVCKQADAVLAHFLLEDEVKPSTIENSLKYYEKITTHDSSLSTCIFSIMAAKMGDIQKAYDYFTETVRLDLDNTHHNTKDGIHTANMGGTYMGIVYGFAGLRIKETGLSFKPVIPKEWKQYQFNVCYQNRRIQVSVNKNKCILQLLEGEELVVGVGSHTYRLKEEVVVNLGVLNE